MGLRITTAIALITLMVYSVALRNNNVQLMEDNTALKNKLEKAKSDKAMLESNIMSGTCLPRIAKFDKELGNA